jgi:hypothetical protein
MAGDDVTRETSGPTRLDAAEGLGRPGAGLRRPPGDGCPWARMAGGGTCVVCYTGAAVGGGVGPGWTRVCRRTRRTMLAKMFSYTPIGIDAVEVEVDVSADVRGDVRGGDVRGGHSGS